MGEIAGKPQEHPYAEGIREGVRKITKQSLPKASSADFVSVLMEQVLTFTETMLANLERSFPVEKPVACAVGCGFCCHNHEVQVSLLEALAIANHLNRGSELERALVIRDRIAATMTAKNADDRQPDDDRPRKLFPCPLLDPETNACQVYEVRPLVCRGHNSVDKTACEVRFDNGVEEGAAVPSVVPQRVGAQAVLAGLRLGMIDSGYEDLVLDLTRALEILTETDTAPDRCLADPSLLEPARARTTKA